MLEGYFPVLVFILFAAVFGLIPIVAGRVLGPSKPDAEKLSPFECGFEPFEDARIKFDVRYYLLAILFILFDLEIAFLFPWATILREIAASESIRLFGFFEMIVFLGILLLGYVYVWKKGALDWE
ncbi:MAG: NADH-quinone oxidoreductase subunit A [Proteobacteria bacterium]|nr:NADH-quinone oxidoreductase subunit A [Pseudomonadota bacterium]MBS0369579.1 NADH-quinone oxidoreductase subunit A [Pseudomonadota bacterium]RTL33297.1 MAG: NADH-quinone oxidoreductase subunit A [Rhodocyclaceae bacterium]